MLNENSYTTQELIHYAGVDDRFKPLLADRIARDGMPDSPTEDEVADLEETIEELRSQVLTSRKQYDWLDDLDEAIRELDQVMEMNGIAEARDYIARALAGLANTRKSIAAHPAD